MTSGDDQNLREPSELAGIRVSALVEIALFLGTFLAVDFLFLNGTRFAASSPHPYWLIVLLLAGQYGSREALVAAVSSTTALLVLNWPEQSFQQGYYDYLFETLRLPFLWFAAAVLFGEMRMRHVGERSDLRRALNESQTHAQTLAEADERLRHVKENLETRVASQLKTTTTMYQASKAIDKPDPDDVIAGVTDIVRAVINPDQFSLFVLKNSTLTCAIRDGWSDEDHYQDSFAADSALFREVIGRQRIVCCTQELDERILEDEGILAGSLLQPETGAVVGMLKIERLGFLRLTSSSLQNCRIVCDWIATAYGKAVRFREAERDRVHSDTTLFSHSFLPRQTDYVAVLARRLGFDLSLVTVRLANPDALDEDTLSSVPSVVKDTASAVLRRTDLAFHHTESDFDYALLLPGTTVNQTEIVIGKLRHGLDERLHGRLANARFEFQAEAVHRYQRPALFQDQSAQKGIRNRREY